MSPTDPHNTFRQAFYITQLAQSIHTHNVAVGWWADSTKYGGTIPDKYLIPTKMMLSVSEISEGMEGFRKNLPDNHLPQLPMEAVEIADCIIRELDRAAYHGFAIGAIIQAKLAYNSTRADHKLEARQSTDGKAF